MEEKKSAMKLFRAFRKKALLYSDAVNYFVVLPVGAAIFLSTTAITRQQLIVYLMALAVTVAFVTAISVLGIIYIYRPFAQYCKRYDRGEERDNDLIIRVRERFSSFMILSTLSVLIRWTVGIIIVSAAINIYGNVSFTQLINLWILGIACMVISILLYSEILRRMSYNFSQAPIFDGIHMTISEKSRTPLSSILSALSASVGVACILIAIILSVLSIKVTHVLFTGSQFGAMLQQNAAMNEAALTGFFTTMAWWLLGQGIFWGIIAVIVIKRIMKHELEPINLCRSRVVSMAQGNFNESLEIRSGNDAGMVASAIAILAENIRQVIGKTIQLSTELSSAAEELSSTADSFSKSAESQAATVEQVTASTEEISSSIGMVSNNASNQFESLLLLIGKMNDLSSFIGDMNRMVKEALSIIQRIADDAGEGESSLSKMNASIRNITTSSEEMSGIVKIISEISEQINLLSLNAAIEAARAAEAGRGFAVVADAISKLADQTAKSIGEISRIIDLNREETDTGIDQIVATTNALKKIIDGVTTLERSMQDVSENMKIQLDTNMAVQENATTLKFKSEEVKISTSEQKDAVGQISKSMEEINTLTQNTAAGVEEMFGGTVSLSNIANTLMESVKFFKV